MTVNELDAIQTEALLWRLRLRYPDAELQHAFDAWLAQDPRHAEAFRMTTPAGTMVSRPRSAGHDVAGNDGAGQGWEGHDVAGHDVVGHDGASDRIRKRGLSRTLLGSAILTVAIAAIALAIYLPGLRTDAYEIATAPGAQRVVALDAGTRITLNGATRMRFDRNDARTAALLTGQALFQVRHDAAHPFAVEVAGRVIRDVGTVFDVSSSQGDVRVAVSEGSVIYNPDREAVTLQRGEGVVDSASSTTLRLVSTPVGSVGGWRDGQFVYAGDPLETVASDLSRALGVRVTVASAIATRPFTGTITLDGKDPDQLRRLTPALDATIRQTPDGWVISAGGRAVR